MAVWSCQFCTLENAPESRLCAACGSENPIRKTMIQSIVVTPSLPIPKIIKNSVARAQALLTPPQLLLPTRSQSEPHFTAPRSVVDREPHFTSPHSVIVESISCPACSYLNPASQSHCAMCETLLNHATVMTNGTAGHSMKESSSLWTCPRCSLQQSSQTDRCRLCSTKKRTISKQSTIPVSTKLDDTVMLSSPRIRSDNSADLEKNDVDKSERMFKKIETVCRVEKTSFIDDQFLHSERSIGALSESRDGLPVNIDVNSRMPNAADLVWLRPSQICTKDGRRFTWAIFRDPQPTDIEQGLLGNCWLLSALAVVAERPDLLEHIVMTKQYNPWGVYQIRLCVGGQWQIITVDDFFPCHRHNSALAFAVGRRNQLWVPLIEKALAKVQGSYAALRAGRSIEGLATLSGAPCEQLDLELENTTGPEATESRDLLWTKLLSAKEAGFLMGCSCGSGRREIDPALFKKRGLTPKHAYSLLDVREVNGCRLVRLRNPWGQFVWRGDWADDWSGWTPQLKAALPRQEKGRSGGTFWMSFADFCEHFDSVDICKFRMDWKELRLSGQLPSRWTPSTSRAIRLFVEKTTEVAFTLYHNQSRANDHLDLMLLVLREGGMPDSVGDLVVRSPRKSAAFVGTGDVFLPCGVYLVVCVALSHWQTMKNGRSVVAIHSSLPCFAETTSVPPTTLADSLIALALKEGKSQSSLPGVIPRYLTKDFGGLLLCIDNNQEDRCVQVMTECEGSSNVLSSRGTLSAWDTVPPLHRQVLLVLTHFEPSQMYILNHRLTQRITDFASLRDWLPQGTRSQGGNDTQHVPGLDSALHIPRPVYI